MNLRNVLLLIGVDVKSSRVIRGTRFRRFRENRLVTYSLYVAACVIGALIGWAVGNFYSGVTDLTLKNLISQGATYLFVSLPTLALLYGLVFTQMSQIQRIGTKTSVQPLYWFPISWKEHTLASILASMLGAPLIITVFVCSSILVASVFIEIVPLAVLTVFALLAGVVLASATTEIFKTLQVRLSGAVTKVAGRAAIWIRLLASILFFLIFYLIYFSLYYNVQPIVLVETIAGGQRGLWFIPYLWPGVALSAFSGGQWLEAVMFSLASLLFIYALFLAAAHLNIRFGLYEAPSIRISSGAYYPKAGLLGRLGFSTVEAAFMKKDFRAFTRRRELMYIFIMPIVFAIIPIVSSMNTTSGTPLPSAYHSFLFAYLTVLPGALMTVALGSYMIGSEGKSILYVYTSPVPAASLVKAKYSFACLFSLAVTFVCFFIGLFLTSPSIQMIAVGLAEACFLVFSLGMVSLSFGIKGADFRELPRPRMIRPLWGFINGVVCLLLAAAILSPLIPYGLAILFSSIEAPAIMSLPEYYLYFALPISGFIALVVAYLFHKLAVKNAEEFVAEEEK